MTTIFAVHQTANPVFPNDNFSQLSFEVHLCFCSQYIDDFKIVFKKYLIHFNISFIFWEHNDSVDQATTVLQFGIYDTSICAFIQEYVEVVSQYDMNWNHKVHRVRATLKNKLTFDGQKSGDKIQNLEEIGHEGNGDSEKCFEPNTNFHKGKQ